MNIRIQKLHHAAILPTYATDGASGFDLHALEGAMLYAGESVIIRTGLAVEVPEGYGLFVLSRSGHGFKHGIRLGNVLGLVDADYRGEIRVCLHMDYRNNGKNERFVIAPGDRIAQAVVIQTPRVQWEVVDSLSQTERGSQGFGSTGQ